MKVMGHLFPGKKVCATILIFCCILVFHGCKQSTGTSKPTPDAAKQVLKLRGYDFNEKSFFAAAADRDVIAIDAFLDAGINRNPQDDNGQTPLIVAASRGNLDVVNALLKGGADVNIKDKLGYTAFFRALQNKH